MELGVFMLGFAVFAVAWLCLAVAEEVERERVRHIGEERLTRYTLAHPITARRFRLISSDGGATWSEVRGLNDDGSETVERLRREFP